MTTASDRNMCVCVQPKFYVRSSNSHVKLDMLSDMTPSFHFIDLSEPLIDVLIRERTVLTENAHVMSNMPLYTGRCRRQSFNLL